MLRRTAAKAFGAPEEGSPRGESPSTFRATILPPGGESLLRGRVVDRLYEELHAGMEARLRRASAGGGDAADDALGQLTRPRPRLEGLEFRLEGPSGTLRVIHSLRGFLRATYSAGSTELRGGGHPDELVSVERQGGEYRPIIKPLVASGERSRARPEAHRSGFRFTSVAELIQRFLSRVGLET